LDNFNTTLKNYFGYDSFRLGQKEIVESIINGNDTVVLMPTGGGKSLCYQLPAIMIEGTVIVISPLIALMKDQVDSLLDKGISAALINSSLSNEEIDGILNQASQGKYKLLYVAPERLENKRFLNGLNSISIAFIAVDEAHCISEWGHDFRPAYLRIPDLFEHIGKKPVIALTATATKEVVEDIKSFLKLVKPKLFARGFDRPNLSYKVEHTEDKNRRLLELCQYEDEGSTIVYCGSRKRTQEAAELLKKNGISAEYYNGGLNNSLRKSIQERFITGRAKIIVATNAFGMGIDKSDVRKIIHYDIPNTIEAYYQEAGRAGRDGKPSDCVMLYNNLDLNLQFFFCEASAPDIDTIMQAGEFLVNMFSKSDNASSSNIVYEMANKTGLNSFVAGKILEIFENNRIIKKTPNVVGIQIKILVDPERMKEYFSNISERRMNILEAILKCSSKESFKNFVDLNVKKVLYEFNVDYEELLAELRNLYLSDIIEYTNNDTESFSYQLNYENATKENFFTLAESLKKQRIKSYKKLLKVIDFAETDQCKRNYILDYFADDEYDGNCGHCSNCLSTEDYLYEVKSQRRIESIIKNIINEYEYKLVWQDVIDLMQGKRNDTVMALKLYMTKYYGSVGKFSAGKVRQGLTDLFRKKMLNSENRFSKPIYITEFGKLSINI
jgi:ATP-dependent DNA helicase RecQ